MVNEDIYTALENVDVDGLYDTKRPDGMDLTRTVIVFSQVSDIPGVPIDGTIIGRTERWQVSIYSKDLSAARTAKADVIAALHAYEGGNIIRADFDSGPGEDYDPESLEFHIPIDFIIES